MKKIIIGTLLAISAASAMAEWTYVGEASNGNLSYIDLQSIRKDGNISKVWQIQNFQQNIKNDQISNRFRNEFDCQAKRNRVIAFYINSESMTNASPSEWVGIQPGSSSEIILKIVCAK